MVTQDDIAKKLNISRATVSRALSGKNVKEETKRAIREEVEKSGYTPSAVATILAQKQSRVIYAFIIATVDEGYGEQTYRGIMDAANIWSGYNIEIKIICTNILEKGDQVKHQLQQFKDVIQSNQVDGVMFSALSSTNLTSVSQICKKKKIPLITLDMIYSNDTLCHVGPDYVNLGASSAALLGNLMMCKGDLLIFDYDEGYELNNERMKGFMSKMGEFPEIDTTIVKLDSMCYSSYEKLLESHLKSEVPIAIYAPYRVDHIARFLEKKGLAGKVILISNGINDEIERFLFDGSIKAIVSAKPYYQGAVATNNFFKYFFRPNDFIKGSIDISCNIYIKENYSRYEKIF